MRKKNLRKYRFLDSRKTAVQFFQEVKSKFITPLCFCFKRLTFFEFIISVVTLIVIVSFFSTISSLLFISFLTFTFNLIRKILKLFGKSSCTAQFYWSVYCIVFHIFSLQCFISLFFFLIRRDLYFPPFWDFFFLFLFQDVHWQVHVFLYSCSMSSCIIFDEYFTHYLVFSSQFCILNIAFFISSRKYYFLFFNH